jgi:hypothetical protein
MATVILNSLQSAASFLKPPGNSVTEPDRKQVKYCDGGQQKTPSGRPEGVEEFCLD